MKQPYCRTIRCLAQAFVTSLALTTVVSHATVNSIQLFNTGVNGSGGLLANNIADAHYLLIAAPAGYTTAMTGNGANDFAWLADGPNSRWIGVTSWLAEWTTPGNYIYRTTFDLSGMVPSSATISLSIASDNNCDVYLNGVHTGITSPFAGFTSFSTYSISSGFHAGVNTLDFNVYNGGNPTGLRVELNGYATAVPEPTVLGLAGLATILFAMLRRTQAE
jgi:hypothetical protein